MKRQRDQRAGNIKSQDIFYDNSYCERQLYETMKNNSSAVYSKVPRSVQLDKYKAEHGKR